MDGSIRSLESVRIGNTGSLVEQKARAPGPPVVGGQQSGQVGAGRQAKVDVAGFAYDALGRRIQKIDYIANSTVRYYYNDNWQVLCEKDENAVSLRWFVYGNYIDEVLVMIVPDGQSSDEYFYTHDHLYSPAALLDDAGDVLERYEYDAYGSLTRLDPDFTAWSGTEAGNPYYFTGRRLDIFDSGNLKLQYSRNRYYDYYTGRWLSQDPLGVVPNPQKPNLFRPWTQTFSNTNLYQYVRDNPINNIDPYGLNPLHVIAKRIRYYLAVGEEAMAADEAYNLYSTIAWGGKYIEKLAADLMDNWLKGASQNPYPISADHIEKAIRDKKHAEGILSPREQFESIVCCWPKDCKNDCGTYAKKSFNLTATKGVYYHAFGSFKITFIGKYECKKYKCKFKGKWEFSDNYDWHNGLDAEVLGLTIPDAWALLVERYRGAKPFPEEGTYEGSFKVKCKNKCGKTSSGGSR